MQNGEQEKLEVPPVNNGECYLDQKMLNIIFCQKLSTIVRGSVNTVIVHLFLSVQFCHLNSGCLKNAYLSLSLIYCKGELFLLCMSLHLVYTSRELIPGIYRRNNVQIGRFFFGRDLVFSSCLFILLYRRDTHEIFAQPVDQNEVGSGYLSFTFTIPIFFFPSTMLMCLLVCKVEGYYDIIEEPMDFGTMRAKLQEEIYTTLEQFEVCSFINSDSPFLRIQIY